MPRYKQPPDGFECPYQGHCPHLEGLSTHWVFKEYRRSRIQENAHWKIREDMAQEIDQLQQTLEEQAAFIDRLRAENKRLHQRGFKPRHSRKKSESTTSATRKTPLKNWDHV